MHEIKFMNKKYKVPFSIMLKSDCVPICCIKILLMTSYEISFSKLQYWSTYLFLLEASIRIIGSVSHCSYTLIVICCILVSSNH